jgi:beta-phosphoglucomutase
MLRAVIFDFDGVITDSETLHFRAFNEALAQFGAEITTEDYYKDYLGLNDLECFGLVNIKYRLKLDDSQIRNLAKQKSRIFKELAKKEGRIIGGVPEFLQMLRQNNISTAICSGALLSEIKLILEYGGLQSFFHVIVSANQVKKGKPHPEGLLLALEKLNKKEQHPISASQCIVIEDSRWGLEAARAAGMHTIAVTNSYDAKQLAMAEKIVTNLKELTVDDLLKLCE